MRRAVALVLFVSGIAAGPRQVFASHACGIEDAPSVDLRHAAPESLRIGVALGSGAMHALAHVGVLEAI